MLGCPHFCLHGKSVFGDGWRLLNIPRPLGTHSLRSAQNAVLALKEGMVVRCLALQVGAHVTSPLPFRLALQWWHLRRAWW